MKSMPARATSRRAPGSFRSFSTLGKQCSRLPLAKFVTLTKSAALATVGVLGLFAASGLGAGAASAAENWPEFRGPHGDGRSNEPNLPTKWSEKENVVWKTPIQGKAWSSPVVWDNQVWVTTATPDGKKLSAVGVDLETGKVVHDVVVFEIEKPQFVIERNSYASSTPVIDAGRLFVHYGSHGTACIDTSSGKVLWKRQDLPCNHHRGAASSPIGFENLLILTFDGFDVQYLVALDKKTGETVWKRDRNIQYDSDNGDIKKAYGTPLVFQFGGKAQLYSPSAGASIAYDPRTGEELWRVKSGGMNASARPVFAHDQLFATTADGGFKLFAVKPDGQGDVTKSHVLWKQTKGVPKHSSQVIVGDLMFMCAESGVLTCIDLKDGEVVWQERFGGSFTASPLVAGNHVYFFSEDGSCPVVAAGRKYELLASNKLDDGFMASPAAAKNSLILRTTKNLYRIGGK